MPTDDYDQRFEGISAFILRNRQCRKCDTLLELLDIPEYSSVSQHRCDNLSSRIVEGISWGVKAAGAYG